MRKNNDRVVIDTYVPIIKGHYADTSSEDIMVFQDGYDHDVLVIDKHQAFRFPRTKDHGKKDQVENIFLSIFAKISPISVQEMVAHTDPKTGMQYQEYGFIPGIQLTQEVSQTLSEQKISIYRH